MYNLLVSMISHPNGNNAARPQILATHSGHGGNTSICMMGTSSAKEAFSLHWPENGQEEVMWAGAEQKVKGLE